MENESKRGKKTRQRRSRLETKPIRPTLTAHFCTRSSEMIQQAEQKNFMQAKNSASPPPTELFFSGAGSKSLSRR
jgi:hypothetical protein